jgi:hypothetical protein
MVQAKHDCQGKAIPAVFHRKNNHDWLVILPLEDFMKLYAEYESENALKEGETAK